MTFTLPEIIGAGVGGALVGLAAGIVISDAGWILILLGKGGPRGN